MAVHVLATVPFPHMAVVVVVAAPSLLAAVVVVVVSVAFADVTVVIVAEVGVGVAAAFGLLPHPVVVAEFVLAVWDGVGFQHFVW